MPNLLTTRVLMACAALMYLAGCSPRYDWRDVRVLDSGWVVTFPGKPVEVSRVLRPPSSVEAVKLTLLSTRVDEHIFAAGWVEGAGEPVRQALEAAMLANIGQSRDQANEKKISVGGLPAIELVASGVAAASASKEGPPAVPMTLIMRTLVTPQGVLEVVAISPTQSLSHESARQFIESLRQP